MQLCLFAAICVTLVPNGHFQMNESELSASGVENGRLTSCQCSSASCPICSSVLRDTVCCFNISTRVKFPSDVSRMLPSSSLMVIAYVRIVALLMANVSFIVDVLWVQAVLDAVVRW